jgi:hypothetical protein
MKVIPETRRAHKMLRKNRIKEFDIQIQQQSLATSSTSARNSTPQRFVLICSSNRKCIEEEKTDAFSSGY